MWKFSVDASSMRVLVTAKRDAETIRYSLAVFRLFHHVEL